MQICSDPLETIRCVAPKKDWCVNLPPSYPTLFPYQSGQVDRISGDFALANGESVLIQRIRQRVELHNTPTANETRQILRRLTGIIQKHVPDFVFRDIDQETSSEQKSQHAPSTTQTKDSKRDTSLSSFSQLSHREETPQSNSVSPDSLHHSSQSKRSHRSSHLSSPDIRSRRSSSRLSWALFNRRKNSQSVANEGEDRDSIVTSFPVPGTPHHSQQHQSLGSPLREAVSDMMQSNIPHNDSLISVSELHIHEKDPQGLGLISSTDLQSASSVSPSSLPSSQVASSHDHLSYKSTESRLDLGSHMSTKTESSLNRTPDAPSKEKIRHSKSKESSHRKERVFEKLSRKLSTLTSSQDVSGTGLSPIDLLNQLHIREALAAFEVNLKKETIETLVSRRKDNQYRGFMYWLLAPARCCRSFRTQRRLAAAAQKSMNIALANITIPS